MTLLNPSPARTGVLRARDRLIAHYTIKLTRLIRAVLEAQATELLKALDAAEKEYQSVRAVDPLWYEMMRDMTKNAFDAYYNRPSPKLRQQIIEMAAAARKLAYAEIGIDDRMSEHYGKFIAEYALRSAKRLNGRSYGQLMKIIDKAEKEGRDPAKAFRNRIESWGSLRAGREAQEESVRIACAISGMIFERNGYEVVWKSNPGCCAMCKNLDGRRIAPGNSFVGKGGGYGGLKRHPPLHTNCKCIVSAGRQVAQPMDDGYLIKLREQKQQEHVWGTKWFDQKVQNTQLAGSLPPSYMSEDPKKLVDLYAGTGIIRYNLKKSPYPEEWINATKIIGKTWSSEFGKYIDSSVFKIVYSSKGTHIYPVHPDVWKELMEREQNT